MLRIRPGIFDFEPDLGPKLGQTKPTTSGTVPTDRHTTIPNDPGPMSACFDDEPKLLHCEIAQPSGVKAPIPRTKLHRKCDPASADLPSRPQPAVTKFYL